MQVFILPDSSKKQKKFFQSLVKKDTQDLEKKDDEPESLYPENDLNLTEDDIMKRDCNRG